MMQTQPLPAKLKPDTSWPESWVKSYYYDKLELWGGDADICYANAYRVRRDITLSLIERFFAKSASLLDLAAAQGNFTIACARLGYKVTWNDLRSELMDYVRLKYDGDNISFLPGNIFELPLQNSFDGVLITEIIEHVAHPDQFLASVAGVIKQGGHMVLTTPNGAYFRNKLPRFSDCFDPSTYESKQFMPDGDGHIFLLHEDEIRRFAKANGLAVKEFKYFLNPLSAGHVRLRTLLSVLPRPVVDLIERLGQFLPKVLSRRFHAHLACVFEKVRD